MSNSTGGSRLYSRYGPVAVVTGASSGIGRAMAVQAAAAGLDVVLVARGQQLLDELAVELTASYGVHAQVVAADLGTTAGVTELLEATAGVDVGMLCAAAGFGTSGQFLEADIDTELNMLDVNCRAVLLMTHEFGRRLAARGRGGIVLMGSLVGYQGTPNAAHYAATKAYVQTLAEGLHAELRKSGVDVLSSAPGLVHTGFADRAGMTVGRAVHPHTVAAQSLSALGRRATVAPGGLSKVLSWSLAPLPRSARTRIMGQVMGGMTKSAHATVGTS